LQLLPSPLRRNSQQAFQLRSAHAEGGSGTSSQQATSAQHSSCDLHMQKVAAARIIMA
jgi:hypothetical protein